MHRARLLHPLQLHCSLWSRKVQLHSRPLIAPFHAPTCSQQALLTSRTPSSGGNVVSVMASKSPEASAPLMKVAQVSPLNMFKPYDGISVCLRPSSWSGSGEVWLAGCPGQDPLSQISEWAMKLQFFTKNSKKLDEAFWAAKQCWVEGLYESYIHYPTVLRCWELDWCSQTWVNLPFPSVSQRLSPCSHFISEDTVSPAIYFGFLPVVQLSEAFEHILFISAFYDLKDTDLLMVSSFPISSRFLLTLKHFLWSVYFLPCGSRYLSYHFPLAPGIHRQTMK